MSYLTDSDKKLIRKFKLDSEQGWIDFLCKYENLMRGSKHTNLSMDALDSAFRNMAFGCTLREFVFKHDIKPNRQFDALNVDLNLAREMYSKAATDDEVAAGLGISKDTLKTYLRDRLNISLSNFRMESKALGINALKNRMFDLVDADNEKMILYLAKFFAKMEREEKEKEEHGMPKIYLNLKQYQKKKPNPDGEEK